MRCHRSWLLTSIAFRLFKSKAYRFRLYDFLLGLVINCDLSSISRRFQDIVSKKVRLFVHGAKKQQSRCAADLLKPKCLQMFPKEGQVDTVTSSDAGSEFHRQGPATEELLSPRRVRILVTSHNMTSTVRIGQQSVSVS